MYRGTVRPSMGEDATGFEPSLVCRVVREVRRGYASIDALAARLGLPREKLESIIGLLLSQGYLREELLEACRGCPFRRFCPLARLRGSVRVYRVVRVPEWCSGGEDDRG